MMRTQFAKIVYRARSDCHGYGVGGGQTRVEHFDEAPLGMQVRIGEYVRFVASDSCRREVRLHCFARRAPRVFVGDHQRPFVGKLLREHRRHAVEYVGSDLQSHRIGRGRQSVGYSFVVIHKRDCLGSKANIAKYFEIKDGAS
jgi:hypothetical protein